MDPSRFDDIARSFSLSRRGAIRTLLGAAATGAALLISGGAAGAKPDPFHRLRKRCNNDHPCGELTVCEAGICRPIACLIAGTVYRLGDANPTNRCQICNPDRNHEEWSNQFDGQGCAPGDTGEPCKSAFSGTCLAGVCVPADSSDASLCGETGNPCMVMTCVEGGLCQAVPAEEGLACDNGVNGVCVNRFGTCQTGICVGNQEPNGTSCGFNSVCCNGNCVPGQQCGDPDPGGGCEGDDCAGTCLIDGVYYEFGDHNPANHCQICSESSESPTTYWTSAIDDLTACGEPPMLRACCNGICCPAGECCGYDSDFNPRCTTDCPPPGN